MLHDARELDNNTIINTDICIVGAGAAGITIAREFANSAFDVCLLESGGFEFDADTQSLYKGKNTGVDYWPLDVSRLRYFGGTTNHWGGVSLPLDEDDFEKRNWVDNSGWPLNLKQLIPFYQRAQPILELDEYNYTPEAWQNYDLKQLPFEDKRVITRMLQTSPPTRFGQVYKKTIIESVNINTYIHANVINIDVNEPASHVTKLHVSTLSKKHFSVSAKKFILALGGIENPRLLLLSDQVQKTGLGNQHDLVGRYFADHPYFNELGYIVLSDSNQSIDLYRKVAREKLSASAFLTLSPQTRQQQQLLSSRVHLSMADWSDYSKGNKALAQLSDDEGKESVKSFAKKIYKVIRDIDDVTSSKYYQSNGAKLLKFGAWTELVPDPESRVTLGKETDKFGQRQVKLKWRIGNQEKDSLINTLKIIGTELGRSNLGRLKLNLNEKSAWPWENMTPGLHHMGTTRMHTDAHKGVVDENCKIHGISNLYIAGSSVFPTFGHANPTLTITALALKLADHLKENIK